MIVRGLEVKAKQMHIRSSHRNTALQMKSKPKK